MKILCVHGIGQNAAIFEAFTETIRHFLPDYYEYTFIDGPDECGPAPGIGDIFPGPYYCQYLKFYPSYVKRSHEHIKQVIEEEGPFDGVLTFSQGAACIASMLLHHEHTSPHLPPLFRFAIFMNGSAPVCASSTLGWDVSPGYRNISLSQYLGANALTRPNRDSDAENSTSNSTSTSTTNSSPSPSTSPSGPPKTDHQFPTEDLVIYDENGIEQCVRWWIPSISRERINIPTVHVHGAKDGWLKEAHDLLNMCDGKTAVVWQHGGGHEIPKKVELARRIAELVEGAVVRSQTMMF